MLDSKKYWEYRYKSGDNSGLGSYNELANFKAEVINKFIDDNDIKSIIDYGVGDGNQLRYLKHVDKYTGLDVSETAVNRCKQIFKEDSNKNFYIVDEYLNNTDAKYSYDLAMSNDVIYHLIEDHVYKEYIDNLFSFSKKFIIIYSNNFNRRSNSCHVSCREFLPYVLGKFKSWELVEEIPNKYPSKSSASFFIFRKT